MLPSGDRHGFRAAACGGRGGSAGTNAGRGGAAGQPPRYTEKSDLVLPAGTSSVCVQLVFRDGEVTAPRRFGMSGEETQ